MEFIIGLGNRATSLARTFNELLPQFYGEEVIWTISHEDNIKKENHFVLPEPKTIEHYEEQLLPPENFFSNLPKEANVLFITFGEEPITTYSLRLLETIKDRKITILYLRPDIKDLDFEGKKAERVFYNVFQELARSGRFEKTLLFSIPEIESSLENLTLLNYEELFNKSIVSIIHDFNYYSHQKPIKQNYVKPPVGARVGTMGIFQLENNFETWFFPLDEVSTLVYHLIIDVDVLEKDTELLKKIKEIMNLRKRKFGENRVKFHIQKGTQKTSYGIVMPLSAGIQKE